jgi:hypothetical protein
MLRDILVKFAFLFVLRQCQAHLEGTVFVSRGSISQDFCTCCIFLMYFEHFRLMSLEFF